MQKKLILHALPEMRTRIDSKRHKLSNFLRGISEELGLSIQTADHNKLNIWKSKFDRHYHIFHLGGAQGTRALNMRKAYFEPFWSIEKPNSRY